MITVLLATMASSAPAGEPVQISGEPVQISGEPVDDLAELIWAIVISLDDCRLSLPLALPPDLQQHVLTPAPSIHHSEWSQRSQHHSWA